MIMKMNNNEMNNVYNMKENEVMWNDIWYVMK